LNALTIEQVVSKRRKVVQDMCDQVLLRFEHEMPKRPDWQALLALRGDAVQVATVWLKGQLDGLSQRDAEHYNADASLGGAITQAVESVGHAEAWADGLAKLVPKANVEDITALIDKHGGKVAGSGKVEDVAGLLSASSIDLAWQNGREKELLLKPADAATAVVPLLLFSGALTNLDTRGNDITGDALQKLAQAVLGSASLEVFGGVPMERLRGLLEMKVAGHTPQECCAAGFSQEEGKAAAYMWSRGDGQEHWQHGTFRGEARERYTRW
jgi:hypothetical protein